MNLVYDEPRVVRGEFDQHTSENDPMANARPVPDPPDLRLAGNGPFQVVTASPSHRARLRFRNTSHTPTAIGTKTTASRIGWTVIGDIAT